MPYYYGMRIPYVSNVLSRYPIYTKDVESRDDSGSDVTSTTMSGKSDTALSKQKRRFVILAIIIFVVMGIALTGVAIWLSGEWSSCRPVICRCSVQT